MVGHTSSRSPVFTSNSVLSPDTETLRCFAKQQAHLARPHALSPHDRSRSAVLSRTRSTFRGRSASSSRVRRHVLGSAPGERPAAGCALPCALRSSRAPGLWVKTQHVNLRDAGLVHVHPFRSSGAALRLP